MCLERMARLIGTLGTMKTVATYSEKRLIKGRLIHHQRCRILQQGDSEVRGVSEAGGRGRGGEPDKGVQDKENLSHAS